MGPNIRYDEEENTPRVTNRKHTDRADTDLKKIKRTTLAQVEQKPFTCVETTHWNKNHRIDISSAYFYQPALFPTRPFGLNRGGHSQFLITPVKVKIETMSCFGLVQWRPTNVLLQ